MFPREKPGFRRAFFPGCSKKRPAFAGLFFGRKAAGRKNNLRSQVVLRNASAVSALLCCIIVYNKTSLEKGEKR